MTGEHHSCESLVLYERRPACIFPVTLCLQDVSHSSSCSCISGFVRRVGEVSPLKNSSHSPADRLWLSQRCNKDGNAGVWVYYRFLWCYM